jgi:hypothetical protein
VHRGQIPGGHSYTITTHILGERESTGISTDQAEDLRKVEIGMTSQAAFRASEGFPSRSIASSGDRSPSQ